MESTIYLELTHAFNEGRMRAILSSGQAVVMHRLAVTSKDGDWIVREDEEALNHILQTLESWGAQYRFGAPLDIRWMQGGWSAHFEFVQSQYSPARVRTDFVTRPPRLSPDELAALWSEQEAGHPEFPVPVIDLARLAELKKTNRDKDYPVIGEMARLMPDVRQQILYSRSAEDLADLAEQFPEAVNELVERRPLLAQLPLDVDELESALDAERRSLSKINETRLLGYARAADTWRQNWPHLEKQLEGLPLRQAHQLIVTAAETNLPTQP